MVFHGYHLFCGGYSEPLSGLEGKVGEIQEGCMGVWRSVPPPPISHRMRLLYWLGSAFYHVNILGLCVQH